MFGVMVVSTTVETMLDQVFFQSNLWIEIGLKRKQIQRVPFKQIAALPIEYSLINGNMVVEVCVCFCLWTLQANATYLLQWTGTDYLIRTQRVRNWGARNMMTTVFSLHFTSIFNRFAFRSGFFSRMFGSRIVVVVVIIVQTNYTCDYSSSTIFLLRINAPWILSTLK